MFQQTFFQTQVTNRCEVIVSGGDLVIKTPYDGAFVAALKVTVPATERVWDNPTKSWHVTLRYGQEIKKLIFEYFGEVVSVPNAQAVSKKEIKLFSVHYIGLSKDRNGSLSAMGMLNNGEWKVIFPEEILRDWFNSPSRQPGASDSLYAILGTNAGSTPDEIKTAYRRAAKQWHPDVCKEPNAGEVFKRINHAYQILSDADKKARYDAGLKLQASLTDQNITNNYNANNTYRSPLRCGYILCECTEKLGRYVVEKIIKWEDIVNNQGQTLVSSWQTGADKPTISWI